MLDPAAPSVDLPPADAAHDARATSPYLAAAATGKNRWWRYLVTLLAAVAGWGVGLLVVIVVLVIGRMLLGWATGSAAPGEGAFEFGPLGLATGMAGASFAALLALAGCMRSLHGRSLTSLVTSAARPRTSTMVVACAVVLVIHLVGVAVEAALHPGRYVLVADLPRWLRAAPLVAISAILMSALVELVLRGYVLQGLSHLTSRAVVLVAGPTILYVAGGVGSPELDAAFWPTLALYVVCGAGLTLATLASGGLELALGAQAGMVLALFLFASYPSAWVAFGPTLLRADVFDGGHQTPRAASRPCSP